jgi:hypothetical protein
MACATSAFAQLSGDGYYRVQNTVQERFISIVDNRGSISVQATDADMGALKTLGGGFDRVVSDPSTVIYFNKRGSGYDLHSQGTSSYTIVGYLLTLGTMSDGTYTAYASQNGLVKYLADQLKSSVFDSFDSDGTVVTNSDKTRKWNILPVSLNNYYFGITPDVTASGNYYKSFYAEFPFTLYSSGMDAYYVSKVDEAKSAVVIKDITGGVPAATPVIVKCSSMQPSANKIDVGASTSGSATGNQLKGVYFCNDVKEVTGHRNVTVYDPSTMRVLGTASDGSLAFVKSSTLQYIPANTAYITVSSNAPDELKVYTQSEYDALPTAKRGDLNEDGKVSGLDLVVMANMILGIREKTTAADLNGDGKVSGLDYVILVNIILNQ